MRVKVDLEKCSAHGRCYNFSPEVFERGDQGKSKVIVGDIADDDLDLQGNARAASMMCPEGAIIIEE